MSDARTLAIIPARKGSKRLPGKNMLAIAGKPLIQWTIECAQACSSIDAVCVTSDDDKVLALAEAMDVTIRVKRPASLAEDGTSTSDVVAHALEFCIGAGTPASTLCLLQPTSPLRSIVDVETSLALHREFASAPVVSVCEIEHPLEWCLEIDSSRRIRGVFGRFPSSPSVDSTKHFRLNGAIYVANVARFSRERTFFGEGTIAHVMDRSRSVDIDTADDLRYAEFLFSTMIGKTPPDQSLAGT